MAQCALQICLHTLASAANMLSKIFKKNEPLPPTPAPKLPVEPSSAQIAAQLAVKALWEGKLQSAIGDDAALLTVAKESPLIDIKYAAVEALTSEDALKRAEREFRDHDRRVHRTAKQRYETKVNRRLAGVSAAKLIETAAVLLHETTIPANRLVELDRSWNQLDQTLLDGKQQADYQAAWTKLSSLTRERGEQQLQIKRWLAEAELAISLLKNLRAQLIEGTKDRAECTVACTQVEALLSSAPGTPASGGGNIQGSQLDAKCGELKQGLQMFAAIDARLTLLEQLRQESVSAPAPEPATAGATGDVAVTSADVFLPTTPSASLRWRALAPVADSAIGELLEARFASWQTAKSDARQARSVESRQQAKDKSKALKQVRSDALCVTVTALVEKAEAALAAGQLAETAKYLTAIDDAATNAKGLTLENKLQARTELLQAETSRLKGWQHWGGGRVRDDLVVEAEALATASISEKIAIKQHADAIDGLRGRWKELDKLGGATSRPLWQRFDAALKAAYLPVAAHLAKLKAVRQENLALRNKLLDNLDAVTLAEANAEKTPESVPVANAAVPDWRTVARALENFQTEWRKCGPVEHTVPHKAQSALAARVAASVARLKGPLSEARQVAQLAREKLIARAKLLASDTRNREVITRVRELQSEWQTHAKSLPLMRQVENALWTDFKTATDAVFAQRDAMHAARDTEFKASQASREALIARLAGLSADNAGTEIKRTIAEVDAEWRKCGEAPRAEAARLDAQFRTARDAAQQYLAGSAKRGWLNICDALQAKLALCVEAETAGEIGHLTERWALLSPLPAAWEKSLSVRLHNAQRGAALNSGIDEAATPIAERLLQLESALAIDSPIAFHAARRDFKLRAMKAAIEARQTTGVTNADIEGWIGEVIGQTPADLASTERVATILSAIQNKPLR